MNKLILIVMLFTLGLNTQAFGKKTIEGEYKGRKRISLKYTGYYKLNCSRFSFMCLEYEQLNGKTHTFNIKLSAQVSKTSAGRITVILRSQDKRRCAGFTINLIGEEDGFGGYDLYRNKDDYLRNLNIGTLTHQEGEVNIVIPSNMTQKTNGTNNYPCRWNLQYGLDLKLK